MKKSSLIAALFVVGGASAANAQIAGSDTLEPIARNIIETVCNEVPALTYSGGGSSTGENAMVSGAQDFAPMSRPLACSVSVNAGRASCAIHVADDAIGIFRSTVPGGSSCSNVTRDVLRQIYFGAGTAGTGAGSDCGNATRRGLIASWGSVFGQASCAGESCTTLRHAFRRNDLSGTTDTFRDRIGISTSGCATGTCAVPFCNGNDTALGQVSADNDPVRTPCSGTEDVCGPIPRNAAFGSRNLGVVLSVYVPAALNGGTTLADVYAPQACAPGRFKYLPNPGAPTATCPNGSAPRAGLCLTPVTAADQANCVAGPQVPAGSAAGFDGRAFNAILRNAAGAVRVTQPAAPASPARVTSAFYRLHVGGTGTACQRVDATEQIGCFAGADPCTVGFAGFGASTTANQDVTVNSVNALSGGTPNPAYPLYRKLFVNALNCNATTGAITQTGTGASRPNQNTAFGCFTNRAAVASAVTAGGFFPVAGAGPLPYQAVTAATCF
jgi:ABC-type phosphate transport system substrate-binding protein